MEELYHPRKKKIKLNSIQKRVLNSEILFIERSVLMELNFRMMNDLRFPEEFRDSSMRRIDER